MFKYQIRGENIAITNSIREYAEKKISKLEKHFSTEITVHVNAKVYKDKTAKTEVTFLANGIIFRAEETTHDLYESFDLVVEKLERQVHKMKTKYQSSKVATKQLFVEPIEEIDEDDE